MDIPNLMEPLNVFDELYAQFEDIYLTQVLVVDLEYFGDADAQLLHYYEMYTLFEQVLYVSVVSYTYVY